MADGPQIRQIHAPDHISNTVAMLSVYGIRKHDKTIVKYDDLQLKVALHWDGRST